MAKSKRNRRAKNKIASPAPGARSGALIKADPFVEPASAADHRTNAIRAARSTIFTAELEAVIEIIARDRVAREMRARLGRRLLMPPPNSGEVFDV